MTDYLDFADLKALIIGIVGGFLVLGIHRYWWHLTLKDVERRIRQHEIEKAKLDNLASSDKALIIHAFQGLFLILALICLIIAIQTSLILNSEPDFFAFDLEQIGQLLLWLVVVLTCVGIVISLQRVHDYPQSSEKIDKKIAKLKEKLSRNRQ